MSEDLFISDLTTTENNIFYMHTLAGNVAATFVITPGRRCISVILRQTGRHVLELSQLSSHYGCYLPQWDSLMEYPCVVLI